MRLAAVAASLSVVLGSLVGGAAIAGTDVNNQASLIGAGRAEVSAAAKPRGNRGSLQIRIRGVEASHSIRFRVVVRGKSGRAQGYRRVLKAVDGNVKVKRLPFGRYTIRTKRGIAADETTYAAKRGFGKVAFRLGSRHRKVARTVRVRVTSRPSIRTAEGRVVDPQGQVVADLPICLEYGADSYGWVSRDCSARTAWDGSYALRYERRSLQTGMKSSELRWPELSAGDPLAEGAWRTTKLSDTGTTVVEPRGHVTGTVRDQTGAKLVGAKVCAIPGLWSQGGALPPSLCGVTADDGSYRVQVDADSALYLQGTTTDGVLTAIYEERRHWLSTFSGESLAWVEGDGYLRNELVRGRFQGPIRQSLTAGNTYDFSLVQLISTSAVITGATAVPGIMVCAYSLDHSKCTKTDVAGNYSIELPMLVPSDRAGSANPVNMWVAKQGSFEGISAPITVVPGTSNTHDFPVEPRLNSELGLGVAADDPLRRASYLCVTTQSLPKKVVSADLERACEWWNTPHALNGPDDFILMKPGKYYLAYGFAGPMGIPPGTADVQYFGAGDDSFGQAQLFELKPGERTVLRR